jgi:hypothetical protein
VVVVGPKGPDVDGRWVLNRAIELPSHTTLILLGAYLFLADRANDNLIRNRDPDEGNTDIHVIGVGGARLDGNAANQARAVRGRDVEIWMEQRGMELARSTREVIGEMTVAQFEARRALQGLGSDDQHWLGPDGMLFYNVDDLHLQGFTIGPTNKFAILIERATNVQISDTTLAQDGREPNQDGIAIIGPSERVTISDIIGTCGDDAVGLHTFAPGGRGGPITGVAINNVVIRNRWCSGILRTSPSRGNPIDGVHASNLQLLGGEGYSEAHAVIKLGQSRPGLMGSDQCSPEEHANITVENVFAKDWRGPYCVVFSPVKNLTIRGARGSHTGPFLHNFGQAMDGLTLEDCRTTLVGRPEEPFVTGMIQFSIEAYGLVDTLLKGTPAAIVLDGGPLKDVEIREVSLRSALKPGDMVTGSGIAGLRLVGGTRVESLRVAGLTIEGFETGVLIDEGIRGKDLRFEGLTMRDVARPWSLVGADAVNSETTLAFHLGDR